MELHIRLPGNSASEDRALARQVADLVVAHEYGQLVANALPAHASNPCDDAGCQYLGEVLENGVKWLVYRCNGTIEMYKA